MNDILSSLSFALSRDTSSDPVCQEITDEELTSLIQTLAKNNGVDLEDFDDSKSSYLYMLALREIYWKLALASAPLYEISIDGLKVAKQSRFDHYFKLIGLLQNQIKSLLDSTPSLGFGSVKVATSVISKDYVNPTLRKSLNTSKVNIRVDAQDDIYTYLTLGVTNLTHFCRYQIYVSDNPIIEYYNGLSIDKKAKEVLNGYTFNKNIKVPITQGYVAVVIHQTNNVDIWEEIKVGE